MLAGDCFAARGQSVALPLRSARNDMRKGCGDGVAARGQSVALPLRYPTRAGATSAPSLAVNCCRYSS